MMEIVFKITTDDYLELSKLKNNDISIIKKAKIRYKLSIAMLIIAITLFMLSIIEPFYIPVLVVGTILLITWLLYSNNIYDAVREKTMKNLVNNQFSKSVKQIKCTKITLQ